MISIAQMVAAITGRSIAATARPDRADPAEIAALRQHLAASEGEVQRLLGLLREREKTSRGQEEELAGLRVANERLHDQLDRASAWHPRRDAPPRDPDEALAAQAAQDRRNAVAAYDMVDELRAEVERLRRTVDDLGQELTATIKLVAG